MSFGHNGLIDTSIRTRVLPLGGTRVWGKGNSNMGKGHRAGASAYFEYMSSYMSVH